MGWLLNWQHAAPGTQTHGEQGTLEVIRQLQGFEAPANAWEPLILARRISRYDPADLDRLCLTGVVGWGRLSPHPAIADSKPRGPRRVVPTSVAPITFFVREDSEWMLPASADPDLTANLTANARDVLGYLTRVGASFFADIVRGVSHLQSEVEAALWELVAAGLVTADGFDSLRALIDPRRRAGHGNAKSARPRHGTGRWALLFPAGDSDRTRAVEALCWRLLSRYGVVFRELLVRESNVPAWRDLLIMFRRLEDRGDIRGGRFVSGFIGEQFALPIAVESLRAMRHRQKTGDLVSVAAADPLNLAGILLPGDRVPAGSGRRVTFVDGVVVQGEVA
jgi:ATP-dependent Lhr-like helicase